MPLSLGGGGPGIETTGIAADDDGALDGFWYIDHLDHDFNVFQTIRPEGLHFTLRESDTSTIDYEISKWATDVYGDRTWYKNGDGSSFIAPWRTGFSLRYGTTKVMEGFHNDPGLQHEWGSEVLSVAGVDYTGYLARRHFPFDPRDGHLHDFDPDIPQVGGLQYQIANGDVSTILDDILSVVFGMAGSPGLTWTFAPTGILQNFEMDLGDETDMLAFIQQFVNGEPGIEFDVTPDREIEIATPKFYGRPEDVVLDPDLYVSHRFDDTVDGGLDGLLSLQFGNTGPKWTHFLGSGAGTSEREATAIQYVPALDVFWRLDGTMDFGNVKNQGQVTRMSQGQLSLGLNPVHQIPIRVIPRLIENFWELFKPGQAIYLKLDLGFHGIDSPHEIIEMDVTVPDTGDEECDVSLNQIYDTTGLTGDPSG